MAAPKAPIQMMQIAYQPLFPDTFLVKHWADEYHRFRGSPLETELLRRLHDWATKPFQKETAAEGTFVDLFFKRTWGYRAAGDGAQADGHSCEPQFKVGGAGQGGGTGVADLALGWFERVGVAPTPQVLCEFKDVRSGLDKPQSRKGNDRSPVKQCADYLKEAARVLYGNEPIQPTWGVVSDMNEFRLYWRKKMPAQYQRFILKPISGEASSSLLGTGDDAAFQRFAFWRIFQSDLLLSKGGPAPLEKLLTEQWGQERAIEKDFYREYQTYRTEVFNTLAEANPAFTGTRGRLVRLTQRFLDRCIFVLFCEDMGTELKFPPNILRDVLVGVSNDPDYDSADDTAWLKVKKLFASMRDGSPFRDQRINRFNGGLFASEPDLESLHIPTRLFCTKGQGGNAESLASQEKTLLFFSASYNFGVTSGTLERSVGLYTLGHIFEQSITELEFMEAKAEGRASITELSRRKRDGVYYTPEWITSYIVEETVGAHLAELRQRLGLDPLPTFSDEELTHYQRARGASGKKDKRFNTERVEKYMESLDRFAPELDEVKVVDPACGSGAFLIQALDRLVNERRWLAAERERVTGTAAVFDSDMVTKAVLSQNIYGVDINEESVEITRLALWLHTALPDRPLSSLDNNIRCGNSLIGPDFYAAKQEQLFTAEQRERVNTFDWKQAFPEVFNRPSARAGFDCVVGNPPYVKLQHFRKVQPDVADYLLNARRDGTASPLYASTQTQNFDMYLPFIERGIGLLNVGGRMGFIAPNVWLVNEYGEALRQYLRETRRLERWVDFKDFPVFDEAMTYTALQFFRGRPSVGISCAFAPGGDRDLSAIEWSQPDAIVDYDTLPANEAWVFLPKQEQEFLDRLAGRCRRLESVARGIVVGVQTSADHIYHLERLGPGRYRHFPKKEPAIDVELEDAALRPLVSGEEAKRYPVPTTTTYLLFPYDDSGDGARLFKASELESRFPKTWRYLLTHEDELRKREGAAFDDAEWFRFGRNQNVDKQKLKKLGVAQTVPEMRVFYDEQGAYCFNNVRVNGILCDDDDAAFFLMGILNCRVVDFVFRRRSKPKEPRPSGAYFEANKQYIAPLPIPPATEVETQRIGGRARILQGLHGERRDTIAAITERLASNQLVADPRPYKWFWGDVGDVAHWAELNPYGLRGRALSAWAKKTFEEKLAVHYDEIAGSMAFGSTMCADHRKGELMFFVGQRSLVSGVYVNDGEAPLILAQWRQRARDVFVSDSVSAARVVDWLLDIKKSENRALIDQVDELNRALERVEARIRSAEREIDEDAYDLYGLSDAERLMVEADTRKRWDARIPTPPR